VKIAILIPCHNEEKTIASVVRNFRAACPQADVYVYDNDSQDGPANAARALCRASSRRVARATSCGGCSQTSRPMSMCWSTATQPMMRAVRPRWSGA
jgi:glycosyltransferase involved in cell wall biosynthesis